jgi:hypothetical protein
MAGYFAWTHPLKARFLDFCRKITRSGDAENGLAGETVVGAQLLSTSTGSLQ